MPRVTGPSFSPCAGFIFTNQAQVDYAYAQDWSGTFTRAELARYREAGALFVHEFRPYIWKIAAILANAPFTAPERKMKDTWLTAPYTPRLQPKRLP